MPRKRLLLILGLAIGIPLGLILIVVGLGVLFVLTGREVPVTESDKAVLLRAGRLAELSENLRVAPAAEKFTKTKFLDSSVELNYEYEDAENLFVQCTISIEPSAKDARTTYAAQSLGMKVGLKVGGGASLSMDDRNDLLSWGDQSKCSLIKNGANPVGNFFIARKGKRVFYAVFVGLYIDDPQVFTELLQPLLKRLDAYEP
jgi:hypothetical protein